MSDAVVTRLAVAAIKGTRLAEVDSLRLEAHGALGDRRFFVVDARERMVNGKQLGELQRVVADYREDRLRLELPDGRTIEDTVALGAPLRARFYSRTLEGQVVGGPFAAALSEVCEQPLRLVAARRGAVDRGAGGGMSLISEASLRRLASAAEEDSIDARRFRMTVQITGVEAHEEDRWVGQRLSIGAAVVKLRGHVGRCLVTSRHPDKGEIDLPTLDLLRSYRTKVQSTEPLPFGVYGSVIDSGEVALGAAVSVLD